MQGLSSIFEFDKLVINSIVDSDKYILWYENVVVLMQTFQKVDSHFIRATYLHVPCGNFQSVGISLFILSSIFCLHLIQVCCVHCLIFLKNM